MVHGGVFVAKWRGVETTATAASDEGEHYPAFTDAMELTRLDFTTK